MAYSPSDRDRSEFDAYTSCADSSPTPEVTDQPFITCDVTGSYKYLLGPVLLDGRSIADAQAVLPTNSVAWLVNLSFNDEGTETFEKITAALSQNVEPRNQFGIVINSRVLSAPRVNATISGGAAEISGNFTKESATALAESLRP